MNGGPQGGNWGGFQGGFQQGFGGQGMEFDLNDIFENFGDMFAGGGRQNRRSMRGNDISVDIELSFKESIFGTNRSLKLTKNNACTTCSGTGAEKGSSMTTCTACNGNGKVRETRQSVLGNFTTVRICAGCNGKGKVPKELCRDCRGHGVRRTEETIAINVPAGIEHGEMIRMTGRGEALQGGVPGDLYIKIHVAKQSGITREGDHLYSTQKIKLSDALLGATCDIETLDGKVSIKIPEGITHGELLRIKGKGVPQKGNTRGDFFVKVHVDLPKKLSKTARKLIEDLKKEGV